MGDYTVMLYAALEISEISLTSTELSKASSDEKILSKRDVCGSITRVGVQTEGRVPKERASPKKNL